MITRRIYLLFPWSKNDLDCTFSFAFFWRIGCRLSTWYMVRKLIDWYFEEPLHLISNNLYSISTVRNSFEILPIAVIVGDVWCVTCCCIMSSSLFFPSIISFECTWLWINSRLMMNEWNYKNQVSKFEIGNETKLKIDFNYAFA